MKISIPFTASLDEIQRSNTIIGDVINALEVLLSPEGDDWSLLTEVEQNANDTSRLMYLDRDKKVLRHWEGAGAPAKRLCKFLQHKDNAWSYFTFEFRVAIQDTSAPTIAIYDDVSRMDRTKDLRSRGDRTVLVKKSGVTVHLDTSKNYTRVELMDPSVETYCKVYTKDLAQRLALDQKYLPSSFTNEVFMNPMYGLEKRIVGSGLLTGLQYHRGRMGE